MKQFIYGSIRIQLLNSDIIRIEKMKHGRFCDNNTFFIPHRDRYETTMISCKQDGDTISFGEYKLFLPENKNSLSGLRLEKNGKKIYAYKKLLNSGELPPLNKTPEVFAISDTPRIIVPENGYSAKSKETYKVTEKVQDVYLLLCEKDAKKLRRLYVELTGQSELVRLSTLGGWNSKYYAYNENEAKQLILDYEKQNVPLDVMVIDTDWRFCKAGMGYDINTELFPDMKRFLDFAHEHEVEICFNDHPEPVDGKQVFAKEEIAYREKNLHDLMKKGLDIWWYDRNWSTNLISPTQNVRWETFGLYLFQDITRHYYQRAAQNDKIYRRPVIMGNVVNIANGHYQGILDSASHRYSVQWSGDIQSETESLAQEVENLIKCGNNCIPYENADCGGHLGNPNKELFIRWMQFGTLSPIFRPHCTNYVKRFREPWAYDDETLDIVREYNNLRYRLLPVIYKNAYNNYDTGEPIFKSPAYEFPEDKKAAKLYDEYMLGNDILIKPIAGKKYVLLGKKDYASPIKATYYEGTELQGEPIATAEYEDLNIVLNHTSPEKGVPTYNFSARFETEVLFDRDVELIVCCDDGCTVWIDGEKVFEDKTLHSAMAFPLKAIGGGLSHKIRIDYFQAGGEAAIVLYYCEISTDDQVHTYLPQGKWLDAFDGKIYAGGKNICKKYGLREMPLFVRLGSLIPLACEAHNTKMQKWNKLIYDFYPSKNANDSGYLYEDDTETTAYKLGQYRKSAYESYYDEKCGAFVIKLHASKGSFEGEKCFDNREITIKYHLLKDAENVKKVTLNDVETKISKAKKNVSAFPFNVGRDSSDSDVIFLTLKTEADKEYEIKFYLDEIM